MKRKKLFICLICLVFFASGILIVSVWAASSASDGNILAELVTDKDTYSAEESIAAHITLKNNSDRNIAKITAAISISEGYVVGSGNASAYIESLGRGESISGESNRVVFVKAKADDSAEPTSPATSKPGTSENPNMADSGTVLVFACVFVLAGAALVIVFRKEKKLGRLLSLLLCFALVSSCVVLPAGLNAEEAEKTLALDKTVTVDGADVQILGTVTYTVIYGPLSNTYVTFDSTNILSSLSGANDCRASVGFDEEEGYTVQLTTTKASNDPYIAFNYKAYMQKYGLGQANADTYKYVVIKAKAENCSNTNFELFYAAGSQTGIAGGSSKIFAFDNVDPDWQYLYFDMTNNATWTGNINMFRFDFMATAAAAGESLSIASIVMFRTYDDVLAYIQESSLPVDNALTPEEQAQAEELLKVADPAPAVPNTKLMAEHEDANMDLWFNHTYTKTPAESTESTGLYTYQMKLAKNEIEACQFLLSASSDRKGLKAELTDFKDANGNILKSNIYYGYYFDDIDGSTIADPIPPLQGAFDLAANRSKAFLIKVYAGMNTQAGQYSAVLSVRDSSGREVKRANVYAYVWNFTLPEETSCKTLTDIGWHNIYAVDPSLYNGDDGESYKAYYDYLLENRICGYNLPQIVSTNDDSQLANAYSERSGINEYLNNPRVVAFNPTGWGKAFTENRVKISHNYLSQNPEWIKKAYFYTVDEPMGKPQLDKVNADAALIQKYFEDYQLIVPMHLNSALDKDSEVDFFKYVSDSVTVWCPHTFFYNTYREYKANPQLTYRCSSKLEKNLGTFKERMAAEQKNGDEAWWYVTRFPNNPEITLTIETQAVKYRILFWQQKMYDVDGFLYYLVNDWVNYTTADSETGHWGWNAKHEVENNSTTPYDVYGNGVLLYHGFPIGQKEPVGSFRLECVRDGIEDFEYFTMLDKQYGEGTSTLIIKQITTSLGEYTADEELFTMLRSAVGNLIAAKN